ncbi:MAG TPA: class I SAM-dependent methyltransferase [Acidimicrobiia bacterium]|nr:class I SAM-dependent methyltransferase [Acidimicrobiia bacterium]
MTALPALDALPPTEEVAVCPVCDSASASSLGATRDRIHDLPGEFGLLRCDECGLVRLSPRPVKEGIGYYYPADYYDLFYPADGGGDGGVDGWLGRLRRRIGAHLRAVVLDAWGYPTAEARRLHRLARPLVVPWYRSRVFFGNRGVPRWVEGGRALDVGCASGAFLACLKYYGWEVAGVEPDERMAGEVSERLDCPVFPGEVTEAPFADGSFDLVHLRDVVEHMYDPVASIRAAAALVKPGGEMFVETPNADGVGARQCGPYWYAWESPRHLHLFTPSTLRRVLEEAGLEIEQLTTEPLRDVYAVEDAFRREEAATGNDGAGQDGVSRFRIRRSQRPRAAALAVAAWLRRRVDPLSGDVLVCRARRPLR